MDVEATLQALAHSQAVLEFGTTPSRAFVLVAQLQLALRHPGNTGESAVMTREFVAHLTQSIDHFVPGAAALIEQGWNEIYDVPREYPAAALGSFFHGGTDEEEGFYG